MTTRTRSHRRRTPSIGERLRGTAAATAPRPSGRLGLRAAAILLLVTAVTAGMLLDDRRRHDEKVAFGLTAAEVARLKDDMAAAAKEQAALAAALAAARVKAANTEASRRGVNRTPAFGPIPESCAAYTGARAIGCAVLLKKGFGLDQMPCLDKLWTRESHWNYKAYNRSSGAYGIPQALPGSKMASVADDWRTNPATQIIWGLNYIVNRYRTPCRAWQHSEDVGWY